jgi:hypothetical protein
MKASTASLSIRRRERSMDAPRAFFKASLWFIGCHSHGFHLVDPATVGVA